MKPCLKCSQYHHPSRGQHRCLTYEKFTYLLKDEFMKRNKEEHQKSKHLEQSYLREEATAQKKRQSGEDELTRTVKVKKYHQEASAVDRQIEKKIEQLIDKCRGCRKRHKDCKHLTSTSCDQQLSPQRQRVEQEGEFQLREEVQWEKLIIPPTEQSFKKPFNSRLISSEKKEENKVVYDSLLDNRLCGVAVCEQGEIAGEIDYLESILAQSYKP